MIINKPKYSLQELKIVPAVLSEIDHRGNIDVQTETGMYPLFAAPMESVVSHKNYKVYLENGIMPVIPRTVTNPLDIRIELSKEVFCSFSLNEVEDEILSKDDVDFNGRHICIDIANAHMMRSYTAAMNIKIKYPNSILMCGNIANPKTYAKYAEIGCDYLRCGIGSGNCCTTASNSSTFYPIGSLIDECYQLKVENGYKCKIIADGGIGNFDDINVALALGADYVMCGKLFAQSIDAYGGKLIEYEYYNPEHPEDAVIRRTFDNPTEYIQNPKRTPDDLFDLRKYKYRREHFGMSTKRAQKLMNINASEESLKTSEGIVRWVDVTYTLSGWIDNFKAYLRTAMSYSDAKNLEEFIGQAEICIITPMARQSYFK